MSVKGDILITSPVDVRSWLMRSALPLWSDIGVDQAGGGFVERLMLDGTPDLACAKRVRVQARQIYVFAHAHLLQLTPAGIDTASRGYEFLMQHGCPDGIEAGFVHSLTRHGAVQDARRDSYDHAFLLFAFSWYYRASGRPDVRDAMIQLDTAIQALLRHPNGHGYVVDTCGGDALHQNPHMHMFEAVLAAYDATGDERFLERAHELFALFQNRMFDSKLGVLREFYDAQWQPARGLAGDIIEPGHHCEWIWLLKWYANRVGVPLCSEAYRLHAFVEHYGHGNRSDDLLCDEVNSQGAVCKSSTRSWPQTEHIKSRIAMAESNLHVSDTKIDVIVSTLFNTFLDCPIKGTWIDWKDDTGIPLVEHIPASTFYHIFLSMSEYLRYKSL